MDEVKAERLVQAVERIATCLEDISKHLDGPDKRKSVCKNPQKTKDLIADMPDEKILRMAKNLQDSTDLPNPYPDPNK